LTPTECERLQGFPTGWTLPSENFHLTDDQIDTLRYHAIGNAVSVPVVEWVAKRVRSELQATRPHQATAGGELDFAKERTPDFTSKKASSIEIEEFIGRDDAPKIKWNRGGVMHEGHVLMAPVSMSPKKPTTSTLVKIIDQEKPTSRYFLSPNAATGIIRRVTSQNRELFSPLDLALRRLSKKRP
jgi:DNA (cytosine-5)-methyltransferase 1